MNKSAQFASATRKAMKGAEPKSRPPANVKARALRLKKRKRSRK